MQRCGAVVLRQACSGSDWEGGWALDSSEQVSKLRPFLGLWGLSFPICQMKGLDKTKSCKPLHPAGLPCAQEVGFTLINTALVLSRAAAAMHRGWVRRAEMVVAMWPHGWPHRLHIPGSRLAAINNPPLPVIWVVCQLPLGFLMNTAALHPALANARVGVTTFNPHLSLHSRPSQLHFRAEETSLREASPLAPLSSGLYSAALVCPQAACPELEL